MTATTLRGRLNYKRVAQYFKRSGLTIYVERLPDGEYLLSDKLAMVKCLPGSEMSLYTGFPDEWVGARFDCGKGPAVQPTETHIARFWENRMAEEWHPLTLTRELREVPDSVKCKPGVLWRKFTFQDTQLVERASYFNKSMIDMISPDLFELEDFQFEQIGHSGPMRIAGVYGPIALVMPGRDIEKG